MDATAYGFTVEWFDKQADMIREYTVTVFEAVKGPLEVAMVDPRTKRCFLKRMEMPMLQLKDFAIGSTVNVHARQLKVTKYNDERTAATLAELNDIVSLVTTPDLFSQLGFMLSTLDHNGLRLTKMRLVNNNGPVLALQATGFNAVEKWMAVADQMPQGSVKLEDGDVIDTYFNRSKYPTTAAFDNCSLCVIRPHVVKEGGVGQVVTSVMEAGLEISALEMLQLGRAEATELMEVYKGVLPYYADLIDGMSIGPCIALEVRGAQGVIEKLREVCGPHDVDMARHLRPQSLRARLGKDNANNGVHATDLEGDGEREVSYIFDTLMNK